MARSKFSAIFLAAVLCGALAPACSKKSKPSGEQAPATAPVETQGDGSLMGQIQGLAKTCDVEAASSALKCKKGEQRKLVAEFAKQKTRADAVKTLAEALRDRDPKIQTVAANLLHLGFRSSLGQDAKQGEVSPEVAKGLISAVQELPKPQASQALPAAVHAAMLSGQQEALFKMLEARANDKLAPVAYRYLMTHGRLGAFDKVKQLVAGDQLDVALSAAASPNSMRNWTPEEEKQICTWANELLGDSRVGIATRAAALLGQCSGAFVDTLLARGEQLLKEGKLSQAQVTPFREVCSASRRRTTGEEQPKVSDEQCQRNRKFLEKVLTSKDVDARTKAMVLSALAHQWPDAETLKLMQKYEKDPNPELAKRAGDMVKRLDRKSAPAGEKRGAGAGGAPGLMRSPVPAAAAPAASGAVPAAAAGGAH